MSRGALFFRAREATPARRAMSKEGTRLSAYGFVVTLILLSPWVLIGVIFVGAALTAVRRGLERLERAWRGMVSGRSVALVPRGQRFGMPMSSSARSRQ